MNIKFRDFEDTIPEPRLVLETKVWLVSSRMEKGLYRVEAPSEPVLKRALKGHGARIVCLMEKNQDLKADFVVPSQTRELQNQLTLDWMNLYFPSR